MFIILLDETAKLVFVVTKIFIRDQDTVGIFILVEKMLFVIIRVKAVYFSLFGGFNDFDCKRSLSTMLYFQVLLNEEIWRKSICFLEIFVVCWDFFVSESFLIFL